MEMFTHKEVLPVPDNMIGCIMVLRANALGKRWQLPKFQLVKVTGGFGAQAGKLGGKVYGIALADDEEAGWRRSDFIGEVTAEQAEAALKDERGALPLDPGAMHYLCIGTRMTYGTGADIDTAKRNCRLAKGTPLAVYHCHVETQIDAFTLIWPKGAPTAQLVWEKKGGK